MFPIRLVKQNTEVDFLGKKWGAFVISMVLSVMTLVMLFVNGLNLGIDFTGGILIETRFEESSLLTPLFF